MCFNPSRHRRRVKHRQLIVQSPLIREGLLVAAGDIKNKFKQLQPYLFDGFFSSGDGSRVDIH